MGEEAKQEASKEEVKVAEEKKEEKTEEKAAEEKKEENPAEEKKEEPNPPSPFVLFVDLHCMGRAKKIERSILKIRGVRTAETELSTGKVTVTGTMDANGLVDFVYRRTKKQAKVVPQPEPEKPPEEAKPAEGQKEEKPSDQEAKPTRRRKEGRWRCRGKAS